MNLFLTTKSHIIQQELMTVPKEEMWAHSILACKSACVFFFRFLFYRFHALKNKKKIPKS